MLKNENHTLRAHQFLIFSKFAKLKRAPKGLEVLYYVFTLYYTLKINQIIVLSIINNE